jgi:hypothetical protein
MFAPNPVNNNPWITVAATSSTGQELDIWRPRWDDGQSANRADNPPDHLRQTFVNVRWRRYLTRIIDDGYSNHQANFLRYMCASWNKENPDQQIGSAQLVVVDELTRTDGRPESRTQELLHSQACIK